MQLCPVQFAVDVLLMRVGRDLSTHFTQGLRYPLDGPLRVMDWAEFYPLVVAPSDFFQRGSKNLRAVLLRELERDVQSGDQVFIHVGQGLLSAPEAAYANRPGLVPETFLSHLCSCMNTASQIKSWLVTPGMDQQSFISQCFFLGSELAWLCSEHARLSMLFKAAREGGQQTRDAALACLSAFSAPVFAAGPFDKRWYPQQEGGGSGWRPPALAQQDCGAWADQGGRELRRRAAEGHGGQPVAVPVRRADGQAGLSPRSAFEVDPIGGPFGAFDGSDLGFLAPAAGLWEEEHWDRAAGARKRQA